MTNDVNELLEKVKKLENGGKLDLSSDEDLSIGIMNLISIEEHLFFTAEKTKKERYYEILREVREMRKELLAKIVKDYEGEIWCISKHLLAGSMRLIEVGTKMLGKGDNKEAQGMFDKAYKLYSLFWGLNLKVIDKKSLPKIDDTNINFLKDDKKISKIIFKSSIFDTLGNLVTKAINCCRE
ncbi:hypothetical protein COT49_00400 [candidate division WWE3 bacterium CG08_land_8_20_14_0_20_40_13]|uniref:Uncharacterized protein n=1 Tax=candidate division WWE3 bacterium CG08_land_8_20_14_0_20_40_13 TaxID=1975084 RepID=A0A2H0XED5_UNCKA|nr:MAG: hypothetical protein COT49_00400 [candidate division WWE3 bacterium CG08_land_8_20_14_0_20_40_13]